MRDSRASLSPGAQGQGGGAVTCGADPVWSRAQQSVGTSPPPLARVDSPGDFHALPRLCPSQMLQAPRAEPTGPPRGATAVWYGRAAAAGIPPPRLPPLSPLGILGRSPWRDAEASPTPTGHVGVPRVWLSRERRRGPSGSECGYRAFHRQIRRPRLQPEGGGGSCRCLHGDAPGFAGQGAVGGQPLLLFGG